MFPVVFVEFYFGSKNAVEYVPKLWSLGTSKCNEMTITVHLNVTQWFLAIFMEHNTQHSQLHSLLYF